MDGVSLLFGVFTVLLLLSIVGMQWNNQRMVEGFKDTATTTTTTTTFTTTPTPVETAIRNVLDTMDMKDLCPVFESLRTTMLKNETAGKSISEEEAADRVEKTLALSIPGGALPCPLLTYPKKGSSDLEWLDFLQKVPSDFGARTVLMAIYAMNRLGSAERQLRAVLAGDKVPQEKEEGFINLCPPDVATTRRAEKQQKIVASCVLPEDVDQKTIEDGVQELLKNIVSTKLKVLRSKNINPEVNVQPILQKAKESAAFLKEQQAAAQEGTIRPAVKTTA